MADAEKRRERIQILRSLGFTHQQAFRLANARSRKVESAISQAKNELIDTPRSERSPEQVQRLRSFRNVPIRNNARILTKEEKREQWSRWSSKGRNFPNRVRERIRELNADAGEDPFDSFGYQAAYFEYVEEFDDVEDGDFYEQFARS